MTPEFSITPERLSHFQGGLVLRHHKKVSCEPPLKHAGIPEKLLIAIKANRGHVSEPMVQVGDTVLKGQVIAYPIHPFGAVLVGADHETVLLEQGNIDSVNHAESTLARRAAKEFTEAQRWAMTLYTTAEPCVMCAGTQYWANIGRLVYGMSERQLLDMTGNSSENPTLDVPSRYVFSKGQKNIRIWGPVNQVVDEIAELHKMFWS